MAYIEFERSPLAGFTKIQPERGQARLGALEYVDLRYGDDVRVRVYNKALDIFDLRNKPLIEIGRDEESTYLKVSGFLQIDKIRLREEGEFHFTLEPVRIERTSLIESMVTLFFGGVQRSREGEIRTIAEETVPLRPLNYDAKRFVETGQ